MRASTVMSSPLGPVVMSQKQISSCGRASMRGNSPFSSSRQPPTLSLHDSARVMCNEVDDCLVPPVGPKEPSPIDRVESGLDEIRRVPNVVKNAYGRQKLPLAAAQVPERRRTPPGGPNVFQSLCECQGQ